MTYGELRKTIDSELPIWVDDIRYDRADSVPEEENKREVLYVTVDSDGEITVELVD